jgi:gluconate 2-dehydrogenase gamma chain
MDRRKSIKALLVGTAATGVLIESCNPADKKAAPATTEKAVAVDETRTPKELEEIKKLEAETFFTKEEMATIAVLADIIIPKDEVSGSATDAKVPDFIEFIVKDMPEHKTPMRGGLRWLQIESLKRFDKSFNDISDKQRIEIVDDIAYPNKVKPGMQPGVSFFNLMRDLTTTGFYTSEIGVKDIGYIGNVPTQWNGVPADVLKQYNVAYTEKELKECVSFDKA